MFPVLCSLCSKELALWSSVVALSRRLVVLLRIRTGMEEVDCVAMVKWTVLKESSVKHQK